MPGTGLSDLSCPSLKPACVEYRGQTYTLYFSWFWRLAFYHHFRTLHFEKVGLREKQSNRDYVRKAKQEIDQTIPSFYS